MIRALLLLPIAIFLAACAAAGPKEGDSRFIGVIQSISATDRAAEPAGAVFTFDASGALVRGEPAPRRVAVYRYGINTPSGGVSAEAEEKFAIGDCVEVSGKPAAGASRTFLNGETRMTRSSRCF